MTQPAERCVLLFGSIHDVLRCEALLGAGGVRCDLVPVPRELSAECGMAIEVAAADLDAARSLAAGAAGLIGVWQQTPAGWVAA